MLTLLLAKTTVNFVLQEIHGLRVEFIHQRQNGRQNILLCLSTGARGAYILIFNVLQVYVDNMGGDRRVDLLGGGRRCGCACTTSHGIKIRGGKLFRFCQLLWGDRNVIELFEFGAAGNRKNTIIRVGGARVVDQPEDR